MSTEDKKTKKEKLSSIQILVIERMLTDMGRVIYLGGGAMREDVDDLVMWVPRGTINALRDRQILVPRKEGSGQLILNPKYDFSAMLTYTQPK